LTELFGYYLNSFVGNPDLQPEKSAGWEAGLDQELLDGKVLAGATYFRSKLENEIYTVFGGPPDFIASPANRSSLSKQHGVELSVEGRVSAAWHFAAAWTYLEAKESGVAEVRRPSNIGSLNVGWTSPAQTFGTHLTVRYNGSMIDSNFYDVGPSPVPMDAFTLVNVGFDWRFSDKVQFYGRVENALDERYEEVYTYVAPGRGFFGGVRLKL
jgi:vitamin B12 transporter